MPSWSHHVLVIFTPLRYQPYFILSQYISSHSSSVILLVLFYIPPMISKSVAIDTIPTFLCLAPGAVWIPFRSGRGRPFQNNLLKLLFCLFVFYVPVFLSNPVDVSFLPSSCGILSLRHSVFLNMLASALSHPSICAFRFFIFTHPSILFLCLL